jgi:integrase
MSAAPAIACTSPEGAGTRYDMSNDMGRIRERVQGGKRSFYLDFRPHGRVWAMPSGRTIKTRSQAERLLRDIRADFRQGHVSFDAVLANYIRRVAPGLTVRVKYQKWLDVMEARVASGDLSQSYLRELKRYGNKGGYLEPLGGKRVDAVTSGDLEDLDLALAKAGKSPKTRWHVQRTLQTFFRWLLRREDIKQVPLPVVVTVPEREPNLMPLADQLAALAAIPEDRRGVFLAQRYAGMRPGESSRMDVADFDFETGIATLPASKSKVRKRARIQFAGELLSWVNRNVDPRGRLSGAPLFMNPRARGDGKRWSLDTMEKAWKRACVAAGVPYVSLYEALKHSTATAALRSGVPMDELQAAYRHASKESTKRYARAASLTPVASLSLVSENGEKQAKEPQTR